MPKNTGHTGRYLQFLSQGLRHDRPRERTDTQSPPPPRSRAAALAATSAFPATKGGHGPTDPPGRRSPAGDLLRLTQHGQQAPAVPAPARLPKVLKHTPDSCCFPSTLQITTRTSSQVEVVSLQYLNTNA